MNDIDLEWDVIGDEEPGYVGPGENGFTEKEEVYADDLGTCVAAGLYDTDNGHAYLSHLGTVSRDREDIMMQFQSFLILMPELEEPDIVVTGGGYPEKTRQIDADFYDNCAEATFKTGGIKTVITRLLEEEFDTEARYDFTGRDDAALYADSSDGLSIEHLNIE